MNRNYKYSLKIIAVLFIITGCGSKPTIVSERNLQEHDYLLASVADFSISLPEFHEKLNSSDLFGSGGIIPSDLLSPVLDSIVLDTVMGLKAATMNLSDYPDAYRSYHLLANELMIRSYFEDVVYPRISFDSSEVLDYYKANGGRYYVEEQVFAYNLLIKPDALLASDDSAKYKNHSKEELKEAAYNYTLEVLDKQKEGRSFQALVGEYSHDEISAREQGELGWTTRGKYEHPFDSVAFGLKKGEISKPYFGRDSWHVIYIEDYYEEGIPEMTDEIFQLVAQHYLTELSNRTINSVRDSILFTPPELTFNDEVMDGDLYKFKPMDWVAIVNNQDTVHVFDIKVLEQQWRLGTGEKQSDKYVKKEFVDRIANDFVVIQNARKRKIDTLPHVAPKLYQWKQEYCRNLLWARMHEKSFRPTDSAIQKYYNEHYSEYNKERPYYVQSIIVGDSLTAVYVRDQAAGGADFKKLIEQFSVESIEDAQKRAVLRWVGKEDYDKAKYTNIMITPRGGISRLAKTSLGFEFFRVADIFNNKSVSKVRHLIVNILRDERNSEVYAAFKDELFNEFNVKREGKLPSLHLKPSDYR